MIVENDGFNLGSFAERSKVRPVREFRNVGIREKLELWKKEVSHWGKVEWSLGISSFTMVAVLLGSAGCGVIRASTQSPSERFTLPDGKCVVGFQIANMKRDYPEQTKVNLLASRGIPQRLITSFATRSDPERDYRRALAEKDLYQEADIQVVYYRDPGSYQPSDGTFTKEEEGRCILNVKYP